MTLRLQNLAKQFLQFFAAKPANSSPNHCRTSSQYFLRMAIMRQTITPRLIWCIEYFISSWCTQLLATVQKGWTGGEHHIHLWLLHSVMIQGLALHWIHPHSTAPWGLSLFIAYKDSVGRHRKQLQWLQPGFLHNFDGLVTLCWQKLLFACWAAMARRSWFTSPLISFLSTNKYHM